MPTDINFRFVQSVSEMDAPPPGWPLLLSMLLFFSRGEPGGVGEGAIHSCDPSSHDPPVSVCL